MVLLFLLIPYAHPAEIHADAQKITNTLQQLAATSHIPDYAVVVVRHDSVLFQLDRNPANAGKNYLIGSCSKSFTALAVLKLVKDGKISLDQPIKELLPWFEMKNPSYSGMVTVRQLLNQTSGFERQFGFFDSQTDDLESYEQELAGYIQHIDVRYTPGSTFLYSNLNYVLLGLVIRHAAGESYGDYLTRQILPVAGMTHTWSYHPVAHENNLIQPYHYMLWGLPFQSKVYYASDFFVPAGYIGSNLSDIAGYMQFMLNKTISPAGDTLIPEPLYRELTGMDKTGYAMGWFHSNGDSISMVSHSGLDENFSSSFTFFPDLDLGYAILCNSNSFEFCGKADAALRGILLGKPFFMGGGMEKKLRLAGFFVPLILLVMFIFNILRWREWGLHINMTGKILPVLRWLAGVLLSVIPVVLMSNMYQLHVKDMVRFSPDIAWGLILVAGLGLLSATVRYFGTASKFRGAHLNDQ
jgi:CubicO group peptidase (beta-lactamase class C family)